MVLGTISDENGCQALMEPYVKDFIPFLASEIQNPSQG